MTQASFQIVAIRQHIRPFVAAYVQLLVLVFVSSVGAQVTEGKVYRETSTPEVYLISAGKKIWVPTPAALFAMGFNWSNVVVVPDGTLNAYPRFNIPSCSLTPGSLVFPPEGKAYPLAVVPGAVKAMSRGKGIQLVELYGWLRGVGPCTGDPDFHYELELDTDWALAQGIDLHKILRVGNVVGGGAVGLMLPGFHPRHSVSLPTIHIELNSWEWGDSDGTNDGRTKPPDWTFVGNCDVPATWPFDQLQPTPGQKLEPMGGDIAQRGPYVRVAGSLITDSPHDVQSRPNTSLSRWFAITDSDLAEWEGSVPDWQPGADSKSPDHYARWTEMHPPDLIQVQAPKEPRVTVRAVALAARKGMFGWSTSCEEVDFDIFPEASRPPNSRIKYEELPGPEIFWPSGKDDNNGSWVTSFDDHVHVKARVCGSGLWGSPGRFKAIYRVWWEPLPTTVALDPHQFSGQILAFTLLEMLPPYVPGSHIAINRTATVTVKNTGPADWNGAYAANVKVTTSGSNCKNSVTFNSQERKNVASGSTATFNLPFGCGAVGTCSVTVQMEITGWAFGNSITKTTECPQPQPGDHN
jgi:hypothetical protein